MGLAVLAMLDSFLVPVPGSIDLFTIVLSAAQAMADMLNSMSRPATSRNLRIECLLPPEIRSGQGRCTARNHIKPPG
jgi:hypothetical protein